MKRQLKVLKATKLTNSVNLRSRVFKGRFFTSMMLIGDLDFTNQLKRLNIGKYQRTYQPLADLYFTN